MANSSSEGGMEDSPLKLDLGGGKDFLVRQYNYLFLKEMASVILQIILCSEYFNQRGTRKNLDVDLDFKFSLFQIQNPDFKLIASFIQ